MKNIDTEKLATIEEITYMIIGSIEKSDLGFLERVFNFCINIEKDFVNNINSCMQQEMSCTPVFFAIQQNNIKALEMLLNYKFSTVYNNKSGSISAIEFLLRKYLDNEIKDPMPVLKCLLQNENASSYKLDYEVFHFICKKNPKMLDEMKQLMDKTLWKKINIVNKEFYETTRDLAHFIEVCKKDFQKYKKNVQSIPSLIESNKVSQNQLKIIYSTVKRISKSDDINYLNYGKNNNQIFLKAANLKKWDILEVMLKALNSIELADKTKTLSQLVIMSCESVKGLFEAFVKNYSINSCDIMLSAVSEGKLDLVKKLVSKSNFIEEALNIAKDLENKEIFEYLTKYKKLKESLNSKDLNKTNNQTPSKVVEEFKVLPEKVKPKTKAIIKNEILKNLYEKNKDQKVMSENLLNELKKNNISSDDYKKFVWNQQETLKKLSNSEALVKVHSWIIKGNKYSTDENKIFCHDFNGKSYYFMINEGLFSTLEKAEQGKVLKALEKGFAKTRLKDSGIKLFGGVMEIKILNKNHLFSDVGYVNQEGDTLVIFNSKGTHESISKIAISSDKLQTTHVKSTLPHSDYQGVVTFNDEVNPLGDQHNNDFGDDV